MWKPRPFSLQPVRVPSPVSVSGPGVLASDSLPCLKELSWCPCLLCLATACLVLARTQPCPKKKHQSSTQNVLVFLFLCVYSSKKQPDSCARVCVCVRAKCTLLEEQESELVQLQRCTKHRGGAERKGGGALALSPLCRTVAHHNSNGSLNTRTSACHVTRWLLLISSRPHKRRGGDGAGCSRLMVLRAQANKQTNKLNKQTTATNTKSCPC